MSRALCRCCAWPCDESVCRSCTVAAERMQVTPQRLRTMDEDERIVYALRIGLLPILTSLEIDEWQKEEEQRLRVERGFLDQWANSAKIQMRRARA